MRSPWPPRRACGRARGRPDRHGNTRADWRQRRVAGKRDGASPPSVTLSSAHREGRYRLTGSLHSLDNDEIADTLERVSALLQAQGANPYRVRAYRNGARTLRELDRSACELLQVEGLAGLEHLPRIGKSIASLIQEYASRGRLALLERLEGQVSPEDLFTTVPGIGEILAQRIHRELGVETLEDLELAAHDGRLEALPRLGPRRVSAIRASLAHILTRSTRRRARRIRGAATHERPQIECILAVDAQYRSLAKSGSLPKIAPRRFNPERRAWLPILHAERDGWSFTALYSNTARAHELGRTRDWVVIYYERDGHESQCTVVTERGGPQRGQRLIRGREAECLQTCRAGEVVHSRHSPGSC